MNSDLIAGITGTLIGLVGFAIGVFIFVFWIRMIIDCVKRDFPRDNDRIMWILLLIFTGILGAIIYWFVVCKKPKS